MKSPLLLPVLWPFYALERFNLPLNPEHSKLLFNSKFFLVSARLVSSSPHSSTYYWSTEAFSQQKLLKHFPNNFCFLMRSTTPERCMSLISEQEKVAYSHILQSSFFFLFSFSPFLVLTLPLFHCFFNSSRHLVHFHPLDLPLSPLLLSCHVESMYIPSFIQATITGLPFIHPFPLPFLSSRKP